MIRPAHWDSQTIPDGLLKKRNFINELRADV